ncbi:MAG TPA: ABC transporter permease, partial [Gammaproteobacteria bacterium]|nr:ABC transporter permease [Gammaproteobacteria bacterium]
QDPVADTRTVNPDYFAALGVRLSRGRLFTAEDDQRARGVVVINETLAARNFAPGKALGSQIRIRGRECEVIGIVADAKHDDLAAPSAPPTMYLALAQEPAPPWSFFATRVTGDPAAMLRSVRAAAQDVDRDIPAYDVQPMEQLLDRSVATQRFDAALLSVFGVLAVSLAAVGIFGVVNYAVAQQTREIGVRVALGAEPGRVIRLVLRQGLKFAGAGIVAGIAASLALVRLLGSLLYGVQPTDAATFAFAAALLAAVALLACWLPARRAAKLDPMAALREE